MFQRNPASLILCDAFCVLVSGLILFPGCLIMLSALILPSGPSEQVLIKLCCSIFTSPLTLQQSSAKSGLFLQTAAAAAAQLSHSISLNVSRSSTKHVLYQILPLLRGSIDLISHQSVHTPCGNTWAD